MRGSESRVRLIAGIGLVGLLLLAVAAAVFATTLIAVWEPMRATGLANESRAAWLGLASGLLEGWRPLVIVGAIALLGTYALAEGLLDRRRVDLGSILPSVSWR